MIALHASEMGQQQGEALEEALALFGRLRAMQPQDRTPAALEVFLRAKVDPSQRPEAARSLAGMLRQDPSFRLATYLRGRL